ncbi:hypothetical protein [Streptomyces sp. NRRL B-24484]|uniref:hypothetical protein n=1 Tax=Streptomyces sp. NRRL B-24484 TaxID=1463833 RepID=UPI0004C1744C|nr:hypothetical protein [Streptomyces sp. NRRL B-24484]
MRASAETVAAELFAALLKEAGEWADDSEAGWVDRLYDMPPADALDAVEGANVVPSQLAAPVAAALRFLAPGIYGAPA